MVEALRWVLYDGVPDPVPTVKWTRLDEIRFRLERELLHSVEPQPAAESHLTDAERAFRDAERQGQQRLIDLDKI